VRVIAGRLGGRRLRSVPGDATRPTSDRVRESLFAILGDRVRDARVLDLFAGSGALAVEALSRGAASAVLVEPAPAAVSVIRSNLETLGLDAAATVRRTRAEVWLRSQRDGAFDLALLDPPYDVQIGYLAGVLARLARTALAPGATVVLEATSRGEAPPWPDELEPAEPRRYGGTALHLAAYTGPGPRPAGGGNRLPPG
jgi:16S rRNA (guanine966-N2)-methyltransferase